MEPELKPRLIIVAGPNGSGKTTITEKLLRHEWMQGCEYVNPDIIAQQQFGSWNSPEAVIKAANQAQIIRDKCLAEKKSLAFETVFSSPEKLDFVKRAKAAGFFIRFFYVCTSDPTINAQRVALRVMEGGHDVPISKIISRYYRSIALCIQALPGLDRAYFYDNSVSEADPRLLFRVNEGKLAKVYEESVSWAEEIMQSLT
ncbi:MAG: AAA family ATPase [Candidatus Riflebacteria bacterium GWC2_50_8]|nr:MAG: AAA family ATPase [Candidatus Riflebacteria bacterium GWC2_50_8]